MNFADSQHAYCTGFLHGELRRHGMPVEAEIDDEGNYTDVLTVTIEIPEPVRIQLRVLPVDVEAHDHA